VRRPHNAPGKLDNADYPTYIIGLATDLLGVQPVLLRSLDAADFLTPTRSTGGQAATVAPASPWPAGSAALLDSKIQLGVLACGFSGFVRRRVRTR
jgi:hypothetical protein